MCNGHSNVQVDIGDKTVGVDFCIADLVRVLNANGYPTVASCCGHGTMPTTIPLADGRWLLIAKNRTDGERMTEAFEHRHLAARLSDLERRLHPGKEREQARGE